MFSFGVSDAHYVGDYERKRKRKREKEVVIKVNLPRTLDYTRNVARTSKLPTLPGSRWEVSLS